MTPLKPRAQWLPDCQGKQDFDGPILSVSTRYWPGPDDGGTMTFDTATGKIGSEPYGTKPSAHSSIHLRLGPMEPHDGGGDYLVWAEERFEAFTEAEVKLQVEAWASEQMRKIVDLLGGAERFRKP